MCAYITYNSACSCVETNIELYKKYITLFPSLICSFYFCLTFFNLFYVIYRLIWLIGHLGKLSWKEASDGSYIHRQSVTISANRLKSP